MWDKFFKNNVLTWQINVSQIILLFVFLYSGLKKRLTSEIQESKIFGFKYLHNILAQLKKARFIISSYV